MKRLDLAVLLAGLVTGAAAGLGGYTFVYADGASYLRDDPAACGNCHVMSDHLAGWATSSHRSVATCNSCHTPGDPVGKWTTKASNGFWHAFAFTTGRYPQPLRIRPRNAAIVEAACRDCHGALFGQTHALAAEERCVRCHHSVGHPR